MTKGLVKTIAVAVFVSIALQGCTTQPKVSAAAYISTKVRPDPANPVRLGENYPLESKRLHEEGVCKVKLTVTDQGAVRDVSLTRSTGYSRLDEACLTAFVNGGLLPATQNGKPVTSTLEIPITWKLENAP